MPDDAARDPRELDDDFYWAAAELWLATGERAFLDELTASGVHTADVFDPTGFDFDNLVVLGAAQAVTGEQRFRDGVATGMDYLLGRNALGQSYVTGYGTDATRHLRTRQVADRPPPGALAGGANSRVTPGWPTDPRLVGRPPQCYYLDEPTSETTNDVCIRWNAPLAAVTAALA